MASNVHGRPMAQPRGSSSRSREGLGGPSSLSNGLRAAGGQPIVKTPEQNFEEQQRQCRAAIILESNEMLVWAGMDLCEVCFVATTPCPAFSLLYWIVWVRLYGGVLLMLCMLVESCPDETPF